MSKTKINEKIVCADGFEMSVQANSLGTHSTPSPNDAARYTHVEVGFPNRVEPLLEEWADDPERPTDTVYGYVPAQRIALVCAKHGGIISGELPPGVVFLESSKKGE